MSKFLVLVVLGLCEFSFAATSTAPLSNPQKLIICDTIKANFPIDIPDKNDSFRVYCRNTAQFSKNANNRRKNVYNVILKKSASTDDQKIECKVELLPIDPSKRRQDAKVINCRFST